MALPDDVLAVVFLRLAPRSLAASRCVCKAWRDVIDARRLLRADLLPHSVRGIFLKYQLLDDQVFLAHPSMGPAIDGKLDFLLDPAQSGFAMVLDQCNGLVLYRDDSGLLVLNPATQRWARLPPPPCTEFVLGLVVEFMLDRIARIVFDPAESPHYEVFLVPDNPDREEKVIRCRQAGNTSSVSIISGQTPLQQLISSTAEDTGEPDDSVPVDRLMEWPASTCIFRVFSSRTGRWGERVFAREGEAAGIADMTSREYDSSWKGYAVYWRDALYVLCNEGEFIMRISLSNDKYRVIKMPSIVDRGDYTDFYLGKSEKGLSCASFHGRYDLFVWVLDESCDQTEWALRHQINMEPILCVLDNAEQTEGPWILLDGKNNEDDNPALQEKKFEWDSDNDDVFQVDSEAGQRHHGYMTVLGFHPYKDVVFLNVTTLRAVVYHLNGLIVQDLGNLYPKDYDDVAGMFPAVLRSFPYTPCLTEFPENNLECHDKDEYRFQAV